MLANLIAQSTRVVVRWRRAMVVALALVTVFLAASIRHLHIEAHPDRLLPQDHPYVQALNDLHATFGDKNLIVVGLFPHDKQVFTTPFLQKVQAITARLEKVPGVNPALVQSIAAPQVKDIRGTAEGIEVEPVMEKVPTDAAGLEAVRRRVFDNDLYVGTLVAADASAAGIQASFELTDAAPDYVSLFHKVKEAVAAEDDGTFDTTFSGVVVYASRLTELTARTLLFFPLALVVIGLVHYHAFRTIQGLVLPLVTALMAVVWAMGLMGLLGIALDPSNIATPVLILAVAAGHAVQVLKRFYEEYDRTNDLETAIVDTMRNVGPVMLAAGLVAALSFCSLATFHLASIRTFGLLTAFGIVSALVIELFGIPALRAMLPAPAAREREREAAAHPRMDAFLALCGRLATGRNAPRVLAVTALLVAGCVALGLGIHVDMSYRRALGTTDRVFTDDARVNASLAGTNTLTLLVEGPGENSMAEPAIIDAIAGLERRLLAEPGVGTGMSYVDILRRMHKTLNADKPDAGDLPKTKNLAAQYLFLYENSGGGQTLDTIITPSRDKAKIRFLSHEDSTRYGDHLIDVVRATVKDTFPDGYRVRYSGSLASVSAATQVMVEGKARNIAQIAAIIVVVAGLLLRSLVGGILVAIPLALTLAVNFGLMGAIGLPLDTNTATIAALAVGIGADYAIYFLFRLREELATEPVLETALRRALATSGKAVLFVSSAIAVGYLTLCLSGFSHYVRMGSLIAAAMVVSSTSALVLLPALVEVLRPRFLGIRDATVPTLPLGPVPRPAPASAGAPGSEAEPPHLLQ
jgi:predicted RND superfamily exporter protein